MSFDELDAQVIQQTPKLAARRLAFQLFGDRGLLGALEYGVAVGVNGQRQAEGLEDVLKEQEIAGGIFLGSEKSPGDLAGGVVDSGERSRLLRWRGDRRLRGLGRPASRRMRRTLERDRVMSCSSASVSVRW